MTLFTGTRPPVIIIGAARSGTKIVRDILAVGCNMAVVPYDINYVWRWPDFSTPHDELPRESLTAARKEFVVDFIQGYAKNDRRQVIEKTVSNSMRLDYVHAIFPNAKYIHLIRDGRDVAFSAEACWNAGTLSSRNQQLRIYAEKIAAFPFVRCRQYLFHILSQRIRAVTSSGHNRQPALWGPHYEGMEQDIIKFSTLKVCARQWRKSVEKSRASLENLKGACDVLEIKYESLTENPNATISQLGEHLEVSDPRHLISVANQMLHPGANSTWPSQSDERVKIVVDEISSTLTDNGYSL